MRILSFLFFSLIAISAYSQMEKANPPFERKGFVIGFGAGGGILNLNTNDSSSVKFSTTIPNIKIGLMLSEKLALLGLLTRASYRYEGKDRGFESLQLAAQYWPKDHWWLLAGTGLTTDLPAFYTIKNIKSAGFYVGLPSFSLATGVEVYRKGNFALDLQYRFFYGTSNLPNDGFRTGISNMFIVGVNWY